MSSFRKMSIDELHSLLQDFGYEGPLLDISTLISAINFGLRSPEYIKFVQSMTEELMVLLNLTTINYTIRDIEPRYYWIELEFFLIALGCPHRPLVSGEEAWTRHTKSDKILLLDYLMSEVLAARLAEYNKTNAYKALIVNNSDTANNLKDILIALNLGKPPAGIPIEKIFEKLESALKKAIATKGKQLLGKPLYGLSTDTEDWSGINDTFIKLYVEYKQMRNKLAQGLNLDLNLEPNVHLSDLLAARTTLQPAMEIIDHINAKPQMDIVDQVTDLPADVYIDIPSIGPHIHIHTDFAEAELFMEIKKLLSRKEFADCKTRYEYWLKLGISHEEAFVLSLAPFKSIPDRLNYEYCAKYCETEPQLVQEYNSTKSRKSKEGYYLPQTSIPLLTLKLAEGWSFPEAYEIYRVPFEDSLIQNEIEKRKTSSAYIKRTLSKPRRETINPPQASGRKGASRVLLLPYRNPYTGLPIRNVVNEIEKEISHPVEILDSNGHSSGLLTRNRSSPAVRDFVKAEVQDKVIVIDEDDHVTVQIPTKKEVTLSEELLSDITQCQMKLEALSCPSLSTFPIQNRQNFSYSSKEAVTSLNNTVIYIDDDNDIENLTQNNKVTNITDISNKSNVNHNVPALKALQQNCAEKRKALSYSSTDESLSKKMKETSTEDHLETDHSQSQIGPEISTPSGSFPSTTPIHKIQNSNCTSGEAANESPKLENDVDHHSDTEHSSQNNEITNTTDISNTANIDVIPAWSPHVHIHTDCTSLEKLYLEIEKTNRERRRRYEWWRRNNKSVEEAFILSLAQNSRFSNRENYLIKCRLCNTHDLYRSKSYGTTSETSNTISISSDPSVCSIPNSSTTMIRNNRQSDSMQLDMNTDTSTRAVTKRKKPPGGYYLPLTSIRTFTSLLETEMPFDKAYISCQVLFEEGLRQNKPGRGKAISCSSTDNTQSEKIKETNAYTDEEPNRLNTTDILVTPSVTSHIHINTNITEDDVSIEMMTTYRFDDSLKRRYNWWISKRKPKVQAFILSHAPWSAFSNVEDYLTKCDTCETNATRNAASSPSEVNINPAMNTNAAQTSSVSNSRASSSSMDGINEQCDSMHANTISDNTKKSPDGHYFPLSALPKISRLFSLRNTFLQAYTSCLISHGSSEKTLTEQVKTIHPTASRVGIVDKNRLLDENELINIQKEILKLIEPSEVVSCPNFFACCLRAGWLDLTCANAESLTWLKFIITKIKPYKGASLQIVNEKDFPRECLVSTNISNRFGDIEAQSVLRRLDAQNKGVNATYWRVEGIYPNEMYTHVIFVINRSALLVLTNNKLKANLDFECVEFKLVHRELKDDRVWDVNIVHCSD